MTEHTPGPWRAIPPDEHSTTWYISRDRLGAPLGVVPNHLNDGRPFYIAVSGMFMPPEYSEANARLIAAAPDLLAALEAALWRLKQYDYSAMQPTIVKIEAAIAKARGG